MAIHHLWPETSGGSAAWDPQLNNSKMYDSTQAKEILRALEKQNSGPKLCTAAPQHHPCSADKLCSISYTVAPKCIWTLKEHFVS